MSGLKLSGINKVYPSGAAALYDINLEMRDKEFFVIVGGESSGKSTLLRVIAGLEEATSGEIFIDGKEVSEVDPKDRDIAMVFRSSTLYPALNVFENMAFGLKLRKAPQALIEQRVKAAANILGLNEVLYRKPKVLTAAAKQRVAIGRAIVREPRLYLFDEPLSGLDEKLRLDMLNIIINLQARMQGTFIYATKNLSEAMTIGTRIAVLKNGLIQQIDTPANLYDYPANAYVAFYIGAPTINLLRNAKIVTEDAGYAVVSGDIKLTIPENIVARFASASEYANTDKEVILGVRPEDAEVCKGGALKATVGKVESDGERTYAECDFGGNSMIVRGQTELKKGDKALISVDTSRIYLFDSVTRLTLLERDGGYKKTDFPEADFVPMSFEDEQAIVEKLTPKKENKKKLR